jgi:hypothetical protein
LLVYSSQLIHFQLDILLGKCVRFFLREANSASINIIETVEEL